MRKIVAGSFGFIFSVLLLSFSMSASAAKPEQSCDADQAIIWIEGRISALEEGNSIDHPGKQGHIKALTSELEAAVRILSDRNTDNDTNAEYPLQAYINRLEAAFDHINEVAQSTTAAQGLIDQMTNVIRIAVRPCDS